MVDTSLSVATRMLISGCDLHTLLVPQTQSAGQSCNREPVGTREFEDLSNDGNHVNQYTACVFPQHTPLWLGLAQGLMYERAQNINSENL